MAKKTYEEQLADLQEKKKQLLEQEKRLKAKHSQEERKKRTKHLIQMGGVVYAVLKETTPDREFTEGDVERLAAFLRSQDKRGNYFTNAMNAEANATTPENIRGTANENTDSTPF